MTRIRNTGKIIQIGKRIKRLRIEQGISQAQLAFEANIPRVQVGRIERGELNFTVSTLLAISAALNVSPRFFFDVL
ncbi:MAG: helix-turn-helix transcriptional regulator [Bacteroidia bacterium]|nr:helix-turn-helix transcriptional regulator [Bacteroidia bacterium]